MTSALKVIVAAAAALTPLISPVPIKCAQVTFGPPELRPQLLVYCIAVAGRDQNLPSVETISILAKEMGHTTEMWHILPKDGGPMLFHECITSRNSNGSREMRCTDEIPLHFGAPIQLP